MKPLFNLQYFAEEETGTESTEQETTEQGASTENAENPGSEIPKYTDADVDKILDKKFAEWQRRHEKKTNEAERLGRMTAEEKANERISVLEDKLREYETSAARAEMTKQARALLQDKNINVGDEIIANLISEDAESTKSAVESFAAQFKAAVERQVKDALKGNVPKAGGAASGMTKEQILAVTNKAERQRLITENMHLFKNN